MFIKLQFFLSNNFLLVKHETFASQKRDIFLYFRCFKTSFENADSKIVMPTIIDIEIDKFSVFKRVVQFLQYIDKYVDISFEKNEARFIVVSNDHVVISRIKIANSFFSRYDVKEKTRLILNAFKMNEFLSKTYDKKNAIVEMVQFDGKKSMDIVLHDGKTETRMEMMHESLHFSRIFENGIDEYKKIWKENTHAVITFDSKRFTSIMNDINVVSELTGIEYDEKNKKIRIFSCDLRIEDFDFKTDLDGEHYIMRFKKGFSKGPVMGLYSSSALKNFTVLNFFRKYDFLLGNETVMIVSAVSKEKSAKLVDTGSNKEKMRVEMYIAPRVIETEEEKNVFIEEIEKSVVDEPKK